MRPFVLFSTVVCLSTLPGPAQALQANGASTPAPEARKDGNGSAPATTSEAAPAPASAEPGPAGTPAPARTGSTEVPAPAQPPGTAASPAPTTDPGRAAPAQAQPADGTNAAAQGATPEVPTVALLDFESNAAGREQAPGVSSLLASQIAESPRIKLITQRDVGILIGLEKQREILRDASTCGEACMAELSGAVGARYVIAGRLDRFGTGFVLTANLFDSRAAVSLAKPHATAANDSELPAATKQIARALLSRLVAAVDDGTASGERGAANKKMVLALKGGSNFISSLRALSPSGDLEVGYRFHREWVGFIQIGVAFVNTQAEDGSNLGISVVPSVLGARHLYQVESALQPYWGLGLGIQLSFGDFGLVGRSGLLPTVIGFGGLQYHFTDSFGAMVELKTDLAKATLGLASGRGLGIHLELGLGLLYRF